MVKINNFGFVVPTNKKEKIEFVNKKRYMEIEREEIERLRKIEREETTEMHIRLNKMLMKGIESSFSVEGNTRDKISKALFCALNFQAFKADFFILKKTLEKNVRDMTARYKENPTNENEKVLERKLGQIRKEYLSELDFLVNSFFDF